jgi:signal transduction histidine kinase/CheY-like chemotaxis protein
MRNTLSSPGRSIKTAFMPAEPTGWLHGGPQRVSELAIVAPLGGVVVLALFYMRRVERSAAAFAWGSAWLCLYLGGMLASFGGLPPSLRPIIHLPGSLFPAFLLAGAIAFRDGGALARLPVLLGLCLGVARALLGIAGLERLALGMAVPLELPFMLATVAVMWRAARSRPRSFAEQMLPPVLALLAVVNAADPVARVYGFGLVPLVLAWIATSFVAALLQVASFVERGRDRERLLLLERDILHRVARTAMEGRGPGLVIAQAVQAVGDARWFDAFGIWLARPDGRCFDCAGHSGAEPPPALAHFSDAEPLVREVLATHEPVRIAADLGRDRSRFARLGVGEVVAVALRAGGRPVGIVVAGAGFDRRFGELELRGLASLARELELVLAHVDSLETRSQQAAALAAERRRLRAVVESVPLGILLVDRDDRITMLSRVGAAQLGIGEPDAWIGRPGRDTIDAWADRLAAGDRARLRAWLDDFTLAAGDLELRFEEPEERVLVLTARRVYADDGAFQGRVFVSRDVTEERRVGERLQRIQRMETLGTLASGIAHDFNNQLTAVLGNARLLADRIADGPGRAVLGDLEAAAQHCADLTRSLLDLARPSAPSREPVYVERILREVEALLRATLAPDVALHVRADASAVAHADPAQLRRVVTNLALNARDAVAASGTIELFARRVDAARVEIAVRDSGSGIDADLLERVFDPFFTTKPSGQGTGLGLAIVGRIAAAHGASVEVESAPGEGSCFRLLWPAQAPEHEGGADTRVERDGDPLAAGHAGARERVLLAEDDPGVRRLATRTLEHAGYAVLVASDGEEALALFAQHGDAIDLVLCDLAMPRRDGRAVLAGVHAVDPKRPALLMTGHGASGETGLGAGVATLAKPFRPDELLRAVRSALDRSRTD